jgi:hypothetical protein
MHTIKKDNLISVRKRHAQRKQIKKRDKHIMKNKKQFENLFATNRSSVCEDLKHTRKYQEFVLIEGI